MAAKSAVQWPPLGFIACITFQVFDFSGILEQDGGGGRGELVSCARFVSVCGGAARGEDGACAGGLWSRCAGDAGRAAAA